MIVHFCKFKPARRRKCFWLPYFQRGKTGSLRQLLSVCLAKGSREGDEKQLFVLKNNVSKGKASGKAGPKHSQAGKRDKSFAGKNRRDRGVCLVFWSSREPELDRKSVV